MTLACLLHFVATIFLNFLVVNVDGSVSVTMRDRDSWWELEQVDGPLFDQFRSSRIKMRFVDLDESKVHTCYEYKVINDRDIMTHTDTFCYPSVIVTGYRKSSTSALYSLLSQYPQVRVSPRKENCPFIGDRSIIQYFSTLPRSVEAGDIVLDGCIDLKGNVRMRKLLREPNAFYLVLVRDFASWLWSAYNYWCQPEYDQDCWVGDHWTTPDKHIRTPEAFHDIVMGSINGTEVKSPLLFKRPCEEGKVLFQRYVGKLWTNMPIENTIILASEDLENRPEYVWSRIASAIGMNPQHPKLKAFTEVRYNTQGGADRSTKGADATVSTKQYRPGLYAVSKFQPMWESTRTVLNQCWKDDCLWSSLVTGHRFPACHSEQELQKPREFTRYVTADPALNASVFSTLTESEAGKNMSVYLRRYFQLQENMVTSERPFLLMPPLQCAANFNHTLALNRFGSGVSVKIKSVVKRGHRVEHSGSSSAHSSRSSESGPEEAVLIVSPLQSHRQFARDLIYFATGSAEYVDVRDDGTVETQTEEGVAEKGPRGLPYCSQSSSSSGVVHLVGATPNNIRIQGTGHKLELYSATTQSQLPVNCELRVTAFSKVLYVSEDYLSSAWTSYLQSQNIGRQKDTNSVLLSGDALVPFNWTLWENAAFNLLTEYAASPNITHISTLLNAVDSTDQMVLKVENVVFGMDEATLIKRIIGFVNADGFKSQFALLDRPLSELTEEAATTRDNINKNFDCAALLALKNIPNRNVITSRTNYNQAYSSEELLCSIKRAAGSSSAIAQSLYYELLNVTCDSVTDTKDVKQQVRKCKTRYSQRMYVPTIPRLPPMLLSMVHSDTVTTRLLIEHATGAYTGAMVTNGYLTDLFPAEVFCGQRMSVIAANPKDVILKNTMAGVGTVNLPRFGKNKCTKGGIRGFNQVLLLVRDPFMSVWREYHVMLAAERNISGVTAAAMGSPAHYHHYQPSAYHADMKARLLNLTHHFTLQKLEAAFGFESLQENNFDPPNALIVSFEALINAAAPPPVVSSTHGKASDASVAHNVSRFSVLQEVLHFAQFRNPDPERMECAFKFLDIEMALLELQQMNSYFLSHHHLVCEMNRVFSQVLQPNRFRFLRLYSDAQCERGT